MAHSSGDLVTTTRTTDDDMANNAVATGALFILLHYARATFEGLTSVTFPGFPSDGNQIDVELDFLGSPYRLTVERVTDEASPATS